MIFQAVLPLLIAACGSFRLGAKFKNGTISTDRPDKNGTIQNTTDANISHAVNLAELSTLRVPSECTGHFWPDWRDSQKVPLFVIPGYGGNPEHLSLLDKNLRHLESNLGKFDCLLYQYKTAVYDDTRLKPCRIIRNHLDQGLLWTEWMSEVPEIEIANHSHVAILLEDIDITQINVEKLLRIMRYYNMSVVSPSLDEPAVKGWRAGVYQYRSMQPHPSKIGRAVKWIDVEFMVFNTGMYRCWQNLISTNMKNNPYGLSTDTLLTSVCSAKMALIDCVGPGHHMTKGQPSYDGYRALRDGFLLWYKYKRLGYTIWWPPDINAFYRMFSSLMHEARLNEWFDWFSQLAGWIPLDADGTELS
eukprot:gnl/TRDRNA2_/TRDRNA2_135945_c0_seq1.p1 gnl/TRDRNA2_/TRDRNA2_135945_c0~~gnl/TRDRNA2_/TRDRNA2_135945_c0_seq1.p1  ORF type:complete len:360 (+),score=8.01 gnl/TRDRNA2_/TRDRNA2_135945_c0_seq1:94-1173(+)